MIFHENPMKIPMKSLWNPIKSHEIPWSSMIFHENPFEIPMKSHDFPWFSMKIPMKSYVFPWFSMNFPGVSGSIFPSLPRPGARMRWGSRSATRPARCDLAATGRWRRPRSSRERKERWMGSGLLIVIIIITIIILTQIYWWLLLYSDY